MQIRSCCLIVVKLWLFGNKLDDVSVVGDELDGTSVVGKLESIMNIGYELLNYGTLYIG